MLRTSKPTHWLEGESACYFFWDVSRELSWDILRLKEWSGESGTKCSLLKRKDLRATLTYVDTVEDENHEEKPPCCGGWKEVRVHSTRVTKDETNGGLDLRCVIFRGTNKAKHLEYAPAD